MGAETKCGHPLNHLAPDPNDARGSICGACGGAVNVRLPDECYRKIERLRSTLGWPTAWPCPDEPQLPVVMRTEVERDAVRYEVRVAFDGSGFEEGENELRVWSAEVFFGSDDRHMAGGAAFIEAAREQQRIADEWRAALLREGK